MARLVVSLLVMLALLAMMASARVDHGRRSNARHLTEQDDQPAWSFVEWMHESLTGSVGRKRHKKAKDSECDDLKFRRRSLQLLREQKFSGLFHDLRGVPKFEASGLDTVNGSLWAVFDNDRVLARLDERFEFRDPHNQLIGPVGDESQFEGITHVPRNNTFLAVVEIHEHAYHGWTPLVEELEITSHNGVEHYHRLRSCPALFQMANDNKGFEDIHYYESPEGRQYLFGLCEGNYCKGGERGQQSGNGRVVVLEYQVRSWGGEGTGKRTARRTGKTTSWLEDTNDECHWVPVKVIEIPRSADFTDYSDLAFWGNKVGVLSQEDATLWVGTFDFDRLEFIDDPGRVYNFPRDANCNKQYCNVEGLQFIDEQRIVVASDRAKRAQPYPCMLKDQAVHIFAIP